MTVKNMPDERLSYAAVGMSYSTKRTRHTAEKQKKMRDELQFHVVTTRPVA